MRLSIEGISKVYDSNGRTVEALRDISLVVEEGEFVCAVGPSGCGKTTLLNLVAGLDRPTAGRISINGTPVAGPGPDRVVVFQEYALFPWLRVEENVEFGLRSLRLPRDERRAVVERYLDLVGLQEFRRAYPHELSGGMQQRVALARALSMAPRVLLMDEPFGSLDAQTRNAMQAELLAVWQREPKTVLFVTHSVDEAVFLADRILVFSARPGQVLADVMVDLPRPRKRTSAGANAVRERVLALLEQGQTAL